MCWDAVRLVFVLAPRTILKVLNGQQINNQKEEKKTKKEELTVFTRISAVALIKFFAPQIRRLFEGSAYLRAAFI